MNKKEVLRRWGKEITGDKCLNCGADIIYISPTEICPNCDSHHYKDW